MISTVEKYYSPEGLFAYKVTLQDGTIWTVPHNTANRHYQEIQEWIADGGTVIDNPPE